MSYWQVHVFGERPFLVSCSIYIDDASWSCKQFNSYSNSFCHSFVYEIVGGAAIQ